MYTAKEAAIIVVIIALIFLGIGTYLGYSIWGSNPSIAPTYALEKTCSNGECHFVTSSDPNANPPDFWQFWQEATKDTQFTIDGKPVEITDVQVFYKKGWYSHNSVNTLYGNITYYPSGIENSQTYVAPTPISPWSGCHWCGTVIVNSQEELDALCFDFGHHSWYGFPVTRTCDGFPCNVNVDMVIKSGDQFPKGTLWESKTEYTVNCYPPYDYCVFCK